MIDLPTPETDAVAEKNIYGVACKVDVDFARKLERQRDELQDALEHAQMTIGSIVSPSDKATLELIKVTKERDEARAAAKLITMDESLYAAKCIEVYAAITPEGIEDLWPPEIQRIIHEMHEIGERLNGRLKGNINQNSSQ